jgi:uncharacterized membrane protein YcaP (DUF421 family)
MEQLWYDLFGTEHNMSLAQECARTVLIFLYGLLLLRLSGRRTFADWSAFDIILSIIIGSSLSRALTGDAPLLGTFAAAAVLTVLHVLVGYLVASNTTLSRVIEGGPVELAIDGRIDHRARRRTMISEYDIREALRARGLEDVGDTKRIVLEASGAITVIKKKARPNEE